MAGNDFVDQVEMVAGIADNGANALKTIEFADAADRWLAHKIRSKEPKPGEIEIMQDQMSSAADALERNIAIVADNVGKKTNELIDAIWETAKKELKRLKGKPRSKVKVGIFSGCPIIYAGPKSCILLDKEKNELLYLTPECVASSKYCEEEKIKSKKKTKIYYCYQLVFIDGRESYIRVSERHRKNIESCGRQNIKEPIPEEHSSGEYEDNVGDKREDNEG